LTRLGRWCALGAAVLGVATIATWSLDDESAGEAQQAEPAGSNITAPVEDSLDGAELFVAKGCVSCHVGPDTTPMVSGFPSLDGAGAWAGTRKPGMTAEEYLTESMLSPRAFISPAFNGAMGPTDGMPLLILSEVEIEALVAYLLEH